MGINETLEKGSVITFDDLLERIRILTDASIGQSSWTKLFGITRLSFSKNKIFDGLYIVGVYSFLLKRLDWEIQSEDPFTGDLRILEGGELNQALSDFNEQIDHFTNPGKKIINSTAQSVWCVLYWFD